jgi:hypothetical protein
MWWRRGPFPASPAGLGRATDVGTTRLSGLQQEEEEQPQQSRSLRPLWGLAMLQRVALASATTCLCLWLYT